MWLRMVATGSLDEDEVAVVAAMMVGLVFGGLAWAETPGMRRLQFINELSINLVGSGKQFHNREFGGGR